MRLIDFNNPEDNRYLAVTQLWIKGERCFRRPDVLALRQRHPAGLHRAEKLERQAETAYDDNLTNYKQEIPQLFLTNAFCVLSNAIETKVGSITGGMGAFLQLAARRRRKGEDRPREASSEQGHEPGRRDCRSLPPKATAGLRRELHPLLQGNAKDHRPEPPVHRREPALMSPFLKRENEGQARRVLAHAGLGQELLDDFLCPQNLPQTDRQFHFCGRDRPRRPGRADLP